jgi:hypothetical protein
MGGLVGSITKGVLAGNAAFEILERGIGAVVEVIHESVAAATEAEAVNVRLAAALHATGRDAEISSSQLEGMATALEHASAFDDEAIKSAYQALSQFENIPTDKINSITRAAMDMTAAMGGDLASNAEMIGRILETGVIPRTYGFSIALRQQIQAEVAAGQSGKALADVLGAIQARYGGQAVAQMNTAAGATERLKNSWSDYLESLASPMLPTATQGQLGMAQAVDQATESLVNERQAMGMLGIQGRMTGAELAHVRDIAAVLAQNQRYANGMRGGVQVPTELDATPVLDYKGALDDLKSATIGSGGLGDAFDTFSAKVADLNKQLAEEPSLKGKQDIQKQIDDETAAYERQTAQIIYNTQAKYIERNMPAGKAQMDTLTALEYHYGLIDGKQKALQDSSNALLVSQVDLLNKGAITADQFVANIEKGGDAWRQFAKGAEEAGQAGVDAADQVASHWEQVTNPKGLGRGKFSWKYVPGTKPTAAPGSDKDWNGMGVAPKIDVTAIGTAKEATAAAAKTTAAVGENAVAAANQLTSTLTPAMADLTGQTNEATGQMGDLLKQLVKLDGMTAVATVVVNYEYNGGSGYIGGTSKTVVGTTTGGAFSDNKERWAGGPLNKGGWTLVGDAPGGGLTPYSELIDPQGNVIPASQTRALMASGAFRPKHAYGGLGTLADYMGGMSDRNITLNVNMNINGRNAPVAMTPETVLAILDNIS